MRGRKPKPRRGSMLAKDALPRCPPHLSAVARKEWRRLATPLYAAGILTLADRAAFAAYCQAWARWVEAEAQLFDGLPVRFWSDADHQRVEVGQDGMNTYHIENLSDRPIRIRR